MNHYDAELNYGWVRSHDDYEIHHAFELTDPDEATDDEMGKKLAATLETMPEDDDYNWNVKRVLMPDTLVRKIENNHINRLMKEAGSPEKAYEMYRLWWMIEHGFTLTDLMQELGQLQYSDPEDSDRITTPVRELFAEWESDVGFGSGSVWPCYNEFLDCEYKEAEK